ncbi:hypothetical protein SPRG_02484 [Saprolegnia parasitica CBS 223.65]|uniref:Uncharacterized protein n=1 Tax=Saprolegnia parasitica (strain CBS 223.65) TaxID=695850 RepID=A0A067D223_SAPPC|nr:hypothetical protein SPRG_02484 [Saprolegnia parasitica CBS 223.65]KDO32786.1 hypothetical protein SPRG_02484 [Saprolegnia parasitica CBS 223.65]|eukprot:XP_012196449.1 hypothetical protein SPRG_02484 [Saprolegnia parasitica CBS 223.65]
MLSNVRLPVRPNNARGQDTCLASPVLRSPDLVAIIVAYQEGLPEDLTVVQRFADAVNLTRFSIQDLPGAYLAHVPARFAFLPYLQRYAHPMTKLPHHALFVSPSVYDRALALHLTIVEGDVALVQRWLRWDASLCTSATLELAAAASQGPILRLLFEQFPALATPKMMDLVAMSGDLPLLVWLHEAGAACTTDAMDGAAMNGHYDIVHFLHSARTEGCTITAATAATVHGHASIVHFLLEQRTEGVDPSLQFKRPHHELKTHSVRGETHIEAVDLVAATVELTDHAFNMIVDKGGLAVLRHVYARGYLKRMTKQLLELAVAKQDHEMLRYILACIDQEHPRQPSDDEWLPTDTPDKTFSFSRMVNDPSPFGHWEHCNVMELAALNGDMTSLELLHASRLRVGSEQAIVFAAYGGHLNVLDWLHKNRRDGCGEDAMALAAARGHFDAVRWLHEVYGLCRTHAALATAAYIGHMAMVTYLLDVPTGDSGLQGDARVCPDRRCTLPLPRQDDLGTPSGDYVTGSPTYWAASQGHLEILELLVARGHALPSNAINQAVADGHLRIVRYLHEGFGQRPTGHQPTLSAVRKRHVDVTSTHAI